MIGRHVSIDALRVDYAMRTLCDADHVASRNFCRQRRLPRRDDRNVEKPNPTTITIPPITRRIRDAPVVAFLETRSVIITRDHRRRETLK
jgi:hypothetical protein